MKKFILTFFVLLILILLAGFGYYRHLTSKDFRLVVMNESPEVVALRIKLGADVKQIDYLGDTLFYYALNGDKQYRWDLLHDEGEIEPFVRKRASDADVVRLLIDAGADIQSYGDNENEKPLLMAIANRDVDTVKLLLSHGADVNTRDSFDDSALMCAVLADAPYIIDVLLKAGADVNKLNQSGESALMHACRWGQTDVIERLLGAGARTDTIASDGQTLIDAAMDSYDKVDTLNALVIYATDAKKNLPKPKDSYLLSALLNDDAVLVRLLIKCGANVNAHEEDDYPLISIMIGEPMDLGILASLIDAGADVNVREKDGDTPLTMSILFKRTKATALLIAAGADLNLDGKSTGPIPLHMAAQVGNLELVRWLLSKGANPNVYNGSGYTALNSALMGMHDVKPTPEMIKLLLNNGADPDIKPKDGVLFFDESNEEIMKLLKSHSKVSPAP